MNEKCTQIWFLVNFGETFIFRVILMDGTISILPQNWILR